MPSTFLSTVHRPAVIGHRGASGYAAANSLAAFELATRAGPGQCDAVELDIRSTADGEIVVIHDATLPGGDRIANLPLSIVHAISGRDGPPIPTLKEAVEVLADVGVCIEVKALPPELDARLFELLAPLDPDRWQIHAFDHRIVARLRRLRAEASLGVLSAAYPLDPVAPVLAAGADTLWQEASLIDCDLVARCHAAGLRVVAWTVNDREDARRLAQLGVDGLCGDWPDRLRP